MDDLRLMISRMARQMSLPGRALRREPRMSTDPLLTSDFAEALLATQTGPQALATLRFDATHTGLAFGGTLPAVRVYALGPASLARHWRPGLPTAAQQGERLLMKQRIFALLQQRTLWPWLLAPLAAFGCGTPAQADPSAAAPKGSTAATDARLRSPDPVKPAPCMNVASPWL